MPKRSLSGTWVHPADGDNYPTELTMKVVESTGAFGVASWWTETSGHPDGTVYRHTFTYGEGAPTLLMSSQRPGDGSWASPHPMDHDRWYVEGGTIAAARERMREFFTELGYTKKVSG